MEEEIKESSSTASYLRYLPLVLGLVGVVLIGLGVFLTLRKEDPPSRNATARQGITISDAVVEASTSGSASGKIFVDVEGAVLNPGVYQIPLNGRVQEALSAAGGLSELADREWTAKNLNLAAKLSDGAKIYIPKVGEVTGQVQSAEFKVQSSNEELININTASLSELDTLPGVGPVTGQKIIDGRPYNKIEDLIEKKVVNNSVWEKIKEKITLF